MADSDVERIEWHEDPERPGVFLPERPVALHKGDMLTMEHEVAQTPEGLLVPMPWAVSTLIRDPTVERHYCPHCGASTCPACRERNRCRDCGGAL